MKMRKLIAVYCTAVVFYLIGVWFHYPFAGGHVYSDIVDVFDFRFCGSGTCVFGVPYVSIFVEYPVIVALFMYSMGVLGSWLAHSLQFSMVIDDYYYMTSLFLAIPTFLLIRECLKICDILKVSENRVLLYVIATPSFLIMLLLNWYILGVWFSTFALRKYLEGHSLSSGILFGLSAASNFVTALPAFGVLFVQRTWTERLKLAVSAGTVYVAFNAPFYFINRALWTESWNWIYNWPIEGSWLYAIFWPNLSNPLRHTIPILVFCSLLIGIIIRFDKDRRAGFSRRSELIKMAWLITFSYLFSTYILTPQMNLILLPFFAIAPIVRKYWEFLAFDLLNSLVIVFGYSTTLLYVFGIHYAFQNAGPLTVIPMMTIARSLWVGKFVVVDGLLFPKPQKSQGLLDIDLNPLTRGTSSANQERPTTEIGDLYLETTPLQVEHDALRSKP